MNFNHMKIKKICSTRNSRWTSRSILQFGFTLTLLCSTSLTYAWETPNQCIYVEEKVLSEGFHSVEQKCNLVVPIEKERNVYYPRMGRWFDVRFWEGGYKRTVKLKQSVLRLIFNTCVLGAPQLISNETFSRITSEKILFAVVNSNVSPDVDVSFKVLPMTNLELQAELLNAKTKCENEGLKP